MAGDSLPEVVAAPVRPHVPAKRWLCARQRGYWDKLSEASQRSLTLQGGAMIVDEATAFEDPPFWREAVALRKCDDDAKVSDRAVPGFADYRGAVIVLLAFPNT